MTRRALLVMAKRPAAGRTKTRLTPPLSPVRATELYTCLLRDTLDSVRTTVALIPCTPFIAYHPPEARLTFRALAPDFQLICQQGQTLSERLENVMMAAKRRGYDQVAAINSDSPALPPSYLVQAYMEMEKPVVDAVFGPCDDGGYYLIGWQRPQPRLLREVTMSTPHVLTDTLAIARQEGLNVALLPPWYDIDDAANLDRLRSDQRAGANTRAFFAK